MILHKRCREQVEMESETEAAMEVVAEMQWKARVESEAEAKHVATDAEHTSSGTLFGHFFS
jgi:hypothetical protein